MKSRRMAKLKPSNIITFIALVGPIFAPPSVAQVHHFPFQPIAMDAHSAFIAGQFEPSSHYLILDLTFQMERKPHDNSAGPPIVV